jgi:hypothetical protein
MPWQALIIGCLAGLVCYAVVCLKPVLKYDDSLDAFGVHGVGGFLGALLTGVFATKLYWLAGSGSPSTDPLGKLVNGDERFAQIGAQLVAAVVAAALAFVGSVVLVKLVDLLCGGFCLDAKAENDGLDQAAHGETGFEFGPSLDVPGEREVPEPRPAMVPPDGQERFFVRVDGAADDQLIRTWSSLCQTGPTPPDPEFLAVYPYLTTVQGNRFRFRGGDPNQIRDHLLKLFQKHLGGTLRSYVESGSPDARNPANGQSRVPTVR